jgi:hypothetical protein
MPCSVAQLLDVARREIGVTETPRGSNITKYGLWFGLSPAPWCSEFVCYVANAAGAIEYVAGARTARGSAYSGDVLELYRRRGRVDMTPRPGAFVIWDWPNAGTLNDHIGIVELVYANGNVGTIEGNSVGVGQVTDSVGRHVRHPTRSVRGYCHPPYAGAPVAASSIVIPPHPNPVPEVRMGMIANRFEVVAGRPDTAWLPAEAGAALGDWWVISDSGVRWPLSGGPLQFRQHEAAVLKARGIVHNDQPAAITTGIWKATRPVAQLATLDVVAQLREVLLKVAAKVGA